MDAEIVTIGTELLLGHIIDTNAAWLAQQLAANGLNMYRKTTVGDNEARIAAALSEAIARVDVVITSGGLGPTVDDKTREAVALATGRTLMLNEDLLASIAEIFKRRGFSMSDNNRRQAYIPEGSIPIPNPVGTAPCFAVPVERGGKTCYIICLPGVPRELKHMMEHAIVPLLRERLGLTDTIRSRIIRVAGITESRVDQIVGDLEEQMNPTVGLAAHAGQIDIRITARAASETEAAALIDAVEQQVRARLAPYIFGTDTETLEGVVTTTLAARGLSLGLVETNTGGRTPNVWRRRRASRTPPSSRRASSTPDVLQRVGGVGDAAELVSPDTAIRAAEYVRRLNETDLGLAVISHLDARDPYGESPGRTYIALVASDGVATRSLRFGGLSDLTIAWSTNNALDLLRRHVLGIPEDAN
ncbi:MAG: CinA family nicotinamide mononucleotide deamidase-related protein [Anaerolineae bacterium]|nr:CinA family nicotinamide mononucleotide deamidase-related protein [Anaerolineae bacterium]